MAVDQENPDSPSGSEEEESQGQEAEEESSTGQPPAEGEEEESGEPKKQAIPYKRFQQVNSQLREYKQGYANLKAELDDLRAQLAAKNGTQTKQEAEEEKPLTPAQIKAIDRVLRQSHPQLFEQIERMQAQHQDSENAMIARAERDITKMAEEAHFATDEESLATLAEMVGNKIRDDDQLSAMWRARDPLCLELAFKKVEKQIQTFQRKSNGQAIIKGKKLAKLPTAPPGGTTTATPKPESKNKGKGITKEVHDDAWAVLQNHMQES